VNADEDWSEVVSVRIEAAALTAYNLTVEDFRTFFVKGSASDDVEPVWVHNGDCADAFKKSLNGLSVGERRAAIVTRLTKVAEERGLVKHGAMSKVNKRTVYQDPETKDFYAFDTQHGHFEITNRRGQHQGAIEIAGDPADVADLSGGHDLRLP
jgi:hypothetical protein